MGMLELYTTYADILHRFLISRGADDAEAFDIVHDTFIKAIERTDKVHDMNHYEAQAWLMTTARNALVDKQRKNKRTTVLSDDYEGFHEDDVSAIEVHIMLDQLPKADAILLTKRYLWGLNASQIATEMGIPHATVRTRIRAAVKRLKTVM